MTPRDDGLGVAGPRGSTAIAAVIGDPVRHSRSPAIHNAGFARAGLDWTFIALHVAAGQGAAAVDAMRTLGIAGLSVTMPHKHDVIGALDSLTATAEALGAVNCIARDGDRLVGHNTDGAGFVASLAAAGIGVAGSEFVVLGAGGAARSVVMSLAGAGASSISVVNRGRERGLAAAALAGGSGRFVELDDSREAVLGAEVLVNATPLGMGADDPLPVVPDALHGDLVVVDLIYHPVRTPLLEAASAAGARTLNGIPMLVHQAAIAFEIWTGVPAPLEAMEHAATGG